jgi:hypothetical protein
MDAMGLRELIRQNDFAHQNRHNLAVVRGRKAVQRLLELTAEEEILVLVEDPEYLAPPPTGDRHGYSRAVECTLRANSSGSILLCAPKAVAAPDDDWFSLASSRPCALELCR